MRVVPSQMADNLEVMEFYTSAFRDCRSAASIGVLTCNLQHYNRLYIRQAVMKGKVQSATLELEDGQKRLGAHSYVL